MAIKWDESMSTGVAMLDDQHKELINQVNRLMEALRSGRGAEESAEVLAFLETYVVNHFRDEEECMDRYKCPSAQLNQQAHAEFVRTFHELKERFDAEGPSLALALQVEQRLAHWFVSHIKGVDCRMRHYVGATGDA